MGIVETATKDLVDSKIPGVLSSLLNLWQTAMVEHCGDGKATLKSFRHKLLVNVYLRAEDIAPNIALWPLLGWQPLCIADAFDFRLPS